jgi:hypothetical protein
MPAGPTEREFQATLVSLLEMFGYVTEHSYPLLTRPKGGPPVWRTGSTLKGKPDLLALRPPRLLAIEVKVGKGRLEAEQRCVLSLFAAIPCARAWVIRDTDPAWTDVQAWVRRPKAAPAAYGFEVMDPAEARAELARLARHRKANKPSRRGSPTETPPLPLGQ